MEPVNQFWHNDRETNAQRSALPAAGGTRLAHETDKTRSHKKVILTVRIPHVRCTVCRAQLINCTRKPQTQPSPFWTLTPGSNFYNTLYACNFTEHTRYKWDSNPLGTAPSACHNQLFSSWWELCSPVSKWLPTKLLVQISFPVQLLNFCVKFTMGFCDLISLFLNLGNFYSPFELYF